MATPTKIHLTPETVGVLNLKSQNSDTAAKASELLQENHEKHHIFFNQEGFHNHIVHHLLTLYGLGASTSQIERAYKDNANYQRRPVPVEEKVVEDMHNPSNFKKYLGKEKYYHDFLIFFQTEMEKKGWEKVFQEYLFAGTEQANDIFGRMYAGFLHPIIHLGFGIEFQQPAIMCEAIAQACAHDLWTSKYLFSVEEAVNSNLPKGIKTIPQLLDEIKADKKLSSAAHWSDANKIRDGILIRAPSEMRSIASQFSCTPKNLKEKTVEMTNSAIYFTAAAQNPLKQVKFDFYYMHCVNSSIFFPTFLSLPWLSEENKVRLLNFKVWLDLAMYASRASPELLLDEISTYVPAKLPAETAATNGQGSMKDTEWPGIFERFFNYPDDGHAVKLGRAVANGERVSKEYENEEWCKIKGFMWEKIGNMVIDSVEDSGATWARSVGFPEAWEEYEDRPRRAQL
ncbi:related to HypA-like protein [Phialocephala subalpina]|uniref:Related to HypA-like protein n=1 Tax=Phialocephala subalpina TaxID=576137 RepID=A0A1L7WV78_9HELO|nr:related to HypA-like protein [Phialocephala subalpina]